MHFFWKEEGVNGSRAPVMTPATEMHVDPPEYDGEVKAWDGEEIPQIPPSTPDGTISESTMWIEAWVSFLMAQK